MAQWNMVSMLQEPYPGRLVAAGISADGGSLHMVTATMGRSPSSQARTYEHTEEGDVLTVPFGESYDPLTVYRAQTSHGDFHIATNGSQTDEIDKALGVGRRADNHVAGLSAAREVLTRFNHEPDPSHTPRISVVVAAGERITEQPVLFSIIRNNPEDPENQRSSVHRFYRGFLGAVVQRGAGLGMTTYEGNGDPLPPFEGGPRPITIGETVEETARTFAHVLDAGGGFLVSAAAKAVSLRTGELQDIYIFNKYGPAANWPRAAA